MSHDDLESLNSPEQESPYVGLSAFEEHQAKYFFGRERDIRLISDNLRAHRLTILYGPSGVGKSSVLQAGVMSYLKGFLQKRKHLKPSKLIFFNNWRDNPHEDLCQELSRAFGLPEQELSNLNLFGVVKYINQDLDQQVYLLLDQFEEYFLYHQEDIHNPQSFAYQLVQLCNESQLNINLLISLREDGFALLDRFKGSIPSLFDNYLRLDKLDRASASRAIRGPLEEYEKEYGQKIALDDTLLEAVLDGINAAKVAEAQGGFLQARAEDEYEAPLLQLIMQRLWQDAEGQPVIHLQHERLQALGGAQGLIQQHFSKVMQSFDPATQKICARIFKMLVTASRSKIAHSLEDLAKETLTSEQEMQKLLIELSSGKNRILRALPNQKYEIYHDTLANAIYLWRSNFEAKEEEAKKLEEKLEEERQAQREREQVLREAQLDAEAKLKERQFKLQRRISWLVGLLAALAVFLPLDFIKVIRL
ncbi:MAG: ATP-binding protein [Deinococcales bacterium]